VPAPPLSDHLKQEVVNQLEIHGGSQFKAAQSMGLKRETFRSRLLKAQSEGFRPNVVRSFPNVFKKEKLGRTHMVIPDTQVKPGVPIDHFRWMANYALDKRPDVIIHIGDWADMHSLSSYDKGKRSYEGRRYTRDIDSANESLDLFEKTIEDYNRTHHENAYNPDKHLCYGNHEQRIVRATDLDAALHGKLTLDDLDFARRGWDCHPFLEVVTIDGEEYSHYFISGSMGRPVSSAAALLKARGGSATMGHVQRLDIAVHPQTQRIGLMCGTAYLHDEDYLGPQGNAAPRQIVMKHEVEAGRYDLMCVSLNFLKKRYS
jgi:hypothetical protein